jgi:hypothetical protein
MLPENFKSSRPHISHASCCRPHISHAHRSRWHTHARTQLTHARTHPADTRRSTSAIHFFRTHTGAVECWPEIHAHTCRICWIHACLGQVVDGCSSTFTAARCCLSDKGEKTIQRLVDRKYHLSPTCIYIHSMNITWHDWVIPSISCNSLASKHRDMV